MVWVSGKETSSSKEGAPGMSDWEETQRKIRDMLDRLSLLAGLGILPEKLEEVAVEQAFLLEFAA